MPVHDRPPDMLLSQPPFGHHVDTPESYNLAIHRATIESSPNGVVVCALDRQILLVSSRFRSIWGCPDHCCAISWDDCIDQLATMVQDAAGFRARIDDLLNDPEAEGYDLIMLRDGRILERYTAPFRMSGAVQGRLWSYHDVTERVSAERHLHESQARLRAIFDSATVGIGMVGLDGRFIETNIHLAEMLARSPEELTQLTYLHVTHPDDRALGEAQIQALQHGLISHFRIEKRYLRSDNSFFWADVSVTAIRDDHGAFEAMAMIVIDITERKHAEDALRASEARYSALAEQNQNLYRAEQHRAQQLDALSATMTEIIGELELDKLLRAILDRAVSWIGAQLGQLALYDEDQGDLLILASRNLPYDVAGIRVALGQGALGYVAQTRMPLIIDDYQNWQDDPMLFPRDRPLSLLLVPLLAGPRLVGVISIGAGPDSACRFGANDIALLSLFAQQATIAIQNARRFAEIHHLATTDPLTKLYNRQGFFDLARWEFERSRRAKQPLSAIMLDIDDFKLVNDRYGHTIGDLALQAIAQLCRANLRTIDLIGRYGGEEIVVLLPLATLEDARQIAERLRCMLAEQPLTIAPHALHITASFGVACFTGEAQLDLERLIDRADQALLVAKRTQKNRVVTWHPGLVCPP